MSNNELNKVAPPTVKSTTIEQTVERDAIACSPRSVQDDVKETNAARKQGREGREGAPDTGPVRGRSGGSFCHDCGKQGGGMKMKKGKRYFCCPHCGDRPREKPKGNSGGTRVSKSVDLIEESCRDSLDRIDGEEIARREAIQALIQRKEDELKEREREDELVAEAEMQRILAQIQKLNYDKKEGLPLEGGPTCFLVTIIFIMFLLNDIDRVVFWTSLYLFVQTFWTIWSMAFGKIYFGFFFFVGVCTMPFTSERPYMTVCVRVGKKTSCVPKQQGWLDRLRGVAPEAFRVADMRTDRNAAGIMKHVDSLNTEITISRYFYWFRFGTDKVVVSHEAIFQLLDTDIIVGKSDADVERLMQTRMSRTYGINFDRTAMYDSGNVYKNSIRVAFDLYKKRNEEDDAKWGNHGRLLF